MDIVEFFQLNSGKWFSQRTSHHLALNQSESGKSDLLIHVLEASDAEVAQLCQVHGIDPALALLGVKTTWTGMMDRETQKTTGTGLLVPIANSDSSATGQLLQSQGIASKFGTKLTALPIAHYSLGTDQVLTVITETPDFQSDERIWFAGANLRLRSSKNKTALGFQTASFCSEIRMGGAAPSS